eukprot:Seg2911.4 transcript_id=Seg2911.4/GoldUCD/mRNA.D3Y31 product="hypothetical protein" protein_id=Seg2911.4/GoldUCD/D3Y31
MKDEVKDEVLQLIETNGVSEDDYLIFDIEKLADAWGSSGHTGKFSKLGHGKLSTFLVDVCGAKRLDERGKYHIKKWKKERKPRRSKKPKTPKASQNNDAAAQKESKSEEAQNLAPCPPTGADSEVSNGTEASAVTFPGVGASKEPGKTLLFLLYFDKLSKLYAYQAKLRGGPRLLQLLLNQ